MDKPPFSTGEGFDPSTVFHFLYGWCYDLSWNLELLYMYVNIYIYTYRIWTYHDMSMFNRVSPLSRGSLAFFFGGNG